MSSIHESLYFNPMMTNVVHANVFGINDWVTPYNISVLALLYQMITSKTIALQERRRLNKLILPLQQVLSVYQGPDLIHGQYLKTVEELCLQTAYAVRCQLHEMADGELKDMECFFATLPTPFSAIDSEAFKTSVVGNVLCMFLGLFMRRMLLAYNKQSFSQVYKLYKALQHYYQSHYTQPGDGHGQVGLPALAADDSDMDLTSTEDTVGESMEKEELDTAPLHESELRQAYLLKNDENKAMKPAALQDELNNPDFAEALPEQLASPGHLHLHPQFVTLLCLILSGSEGKSNGDEGYGRSLRYAALNLAALHCRFGHYQQADLALQEAIRIAQESNYHVCLQHCLVGAFTFVSALTEDSVKMAAHFCLPGSIQGKTAHELMDALKDTDILHWRHSLSEFIDISLAQTTSIWRMYGKKFVSSITQLWMLCDLKIQFDTAMKDGKYHLAEPMLQLYSEKTKYTEMIIRQRHLQALASETILHLAFTQVNTTHACYGQHHCLLGLGQAVQTLGEAVAYFSMLDCKERLRDVHYLQARLHHTLGQTPQRNKCAMLFCLLDQELQEPGAAVAMRL
ncbi:unnamed protein product [Coregonus sp. 'balchen']|nr:unnamed protein product [Coregonus sp. 'balchen']